MHTFIGYFKRKSVRSEGSVAKKQIASPEMIYNDLQWFEMTCNY